MSDDVTPLGYWYHDCPVTGMRRIGHNYKAAERNSDGRAKPYMTCYACGAKRPNKYTQGKYVSFEAMKHGA